MYTLLSLTVSIKDYIEIMHQLIAVDATTNIKSYMDIGPILVYLVLSIKQLVVTLFSFNWLQNLWTLPVIVPDIASAMISEISVFDGYFHTAFTFLDNPSVPATSIMTVSFQKLLIGLANSLFLCLPTSVAHIITLRRFLIQGLEAGYYSGLGVVTGNVFFLASVIFGWRFFLIPWLSLDIFRYVFGFILLVKYIWDSANERRMVLEDLSKWKIFLLTFLLSLTEQTSIFPFVSNLSFSSDATLLESFSATNITEFVIIHFAYLFGILIGSLSLLHLSCWFWENPAFQIYMWAITSFKVKTGSFYKYLNFGLLYLTMLAAIASIPYYGLDYTLTSPLGLVFEDRILEEKVFNELSFLNTGPTDRNTRRNRGRHPRRSRWNRRTRKYRSFQTNLYEKENYDWMTVEDLNFGFDRQWVHRKMRNHRARYRLFPGKLTRSLKDQARKGFTKRHAFFETTENYFYHPSFHEYTKQKPETLRGVTTQTTTTTTNTLINSVAPYIAQKQPDSSAILTKFTRKIGTKIAESQTNLTTPFNFVQMQSLMNTQNTPISSLRWKRIFSQMDNSVTTNKLRTFYQKMVLNKGDNALKLQQQLPISKKDRLMMRYRSFLYANQAGSTRLYSIGENERINYSPENSRSEYSSLREVGESANNNRTASLQNSTNYLFWKPGTLLHPIKYYLQKEQASSRKYQYYGVKNFRTFAPDYNPPLFRVIMQRYFYTYKPTKRWFRTMKGATMRRYLRKSTRKGRILQNTSTALDIRSGETNRNAGAVAAGSISVQPLVNSQVAGESQTSIYNPAVTSTTAPLLRRANHFYSMKGKRASRYRYQIYRDVLQHWYYSPVNRILPKIDIDSFIRRQPTNHFITTSEERILHLRRFLLAEHYDTLRWYTAMKQYKQMKEKIGGTKSLSSRPYNQQFFGTFKKIRHLFAITPSLTDQPLLSFDQSLYNEYENTTIRPIVDTSIFHEELLADDFYTKPINQPGDILTQSSTILKEYLTVATPIRQELITNYIKTKNYWGLTQFFAKGEKTRGIKPVTNQRSLIDQEKAYLLARTELTNILDNKLVLNGSNNSLQQSTLVSLLRKWKKSLGNQKLYKKALKNQFKNWRRHKKRWRKKFEQYRSRKLSENIRLARVSTLPSGVQKSVKDAQVIAQQLTDGSRQIPTTKIAINQLRTETTTNIETQMQTILTKLRTLKTNRTNTKADGFVTRLKRFKRQIAAQLDTTTNSLQTLYAKTKTTTWWKKKSSESWRPSRRRLDIDSLRKRIKRRNEQNQFAGLSSQRYTEEKASLNLRSEKFANEQTWERVNNTNFVNLNILRPKQLEQETMTTSKAASWKDSLKASQENVIGKNKNWFLFREFKRKRVSRRRGRKLGPAGYSRRPNLSALVKRQMAYNQAIGNREPSLIRQDFTSTTSNDFTLLPQKARFFRKRKHRDWEKKVKPNNGIKTGKYRKRRLSFYGKVRSVQKQLIRVRWKLRLQKWWWQYLPALQSAVDAKWQIDSDKKLAAMLDKLTEKQILTRDQLAYATVNESVPGEHKLQIGDRDFKPLQMPEAIRIRDEFENQGKLNFGLKQTDKGSFNTQPPTTNDGSLANRTKFADIPLRDSFDSRGSLDTRLYSMSGRQVSDDPKLQITNAVPFYAGWDESLRKFVVTNVLFSLRDASFEMNNVQNFETLKVLGRDKIEFTNGPLKAQNGATTVYWQTPFTTYETDQFFTLGVDGFSPLQWRRFNFKQSIVKSWTELRNSQKEVSPILVKALAQKSTTQKSNVTIDQLVTGEKPAFEKLQLSAIPRRRQKRYKRVRRHPRAPVWYPSGALISDVLPTQYVYAFDYTARRPRDRYIQRRWRKRSQVDVAGNAILQQADRTTDFTLRRRPNGRRKYHRRGGKLRSLITVAYPQRRKFVGGFVENEIERWRPERLKKETGYTAKLDEVRKRRGMSLRRRKLRQVYPKISRYRPLNGGFVWPGDYLMLEQSKVPKLRSITAPGTVTTKKAKSKKLRRKVKRKARNIAQWNVQPKKYLLQKHNIKVLKKKLQKSYRTNQLQVKLRQLSLTGL
uniref:Hypothetical chloroplast RF1 n=1 Tax=Hafniomonas laevis TaxID=436124 RepID=A0A0S2LNY3_9CHLO|nr:hypothetical chloroplast RF1 [Hafniomonas laevis]ALO63079.1 hypothetical chloroplast RF1 [Hafniomonas laevis]